MIKNWVVTGDTHGLVMDRLNKLDESIYKPEETAMIILGDMGLNFYLNKTDQKNKKAVNATGFAVYAVRGNHEERPENLEGVIRQYDDEVKGDIYLEPQFPNIRYFIDGEVYSILNKKVLVIGGAYSVDKWYRLARAGVNDKLDPNYFNSKKTGWFPSELLTADEMDEIESRLSGEYFDVILTHTCPLSWEPVDLFISGLDQSTVDKSMEIWLNEFKTQIDWTVWLFGHYHDDRLVRPGVEMFYRDIEDWNTIMRRWEDPENLDWWLQKDPRYYEGL